MSKTQASKENTVRVATRGIEQMMEGIASLQREMPMDRLTRILGSAQAMVGTFTDSDLIWMLAVALDKLAVPDDQA